MGIYREFPAITVTTEGSAGSAVGNQNGTEYANGEVVSFYIAYHASAPGTTVVAIKELNGAGRTLVTITGSTSGTFYPRVQMQGLTGTGLTGIYEPFSLAGRLFRVEVTASDALTGAVVVTPMVKERAG